jgi:hypothetical protein
MNSMAFSLLVNSSSELDGSQELELTIGSFSIFVGPSGSSRLSDPTKQDLSASEPETVAMMEYSEGSSSNVNLLVSLEKAPIAESDKIGENFNSEESACQTHNSARDFAVGSSGIAKVHQLCVIITEAEEENNKEVKRSIGKSTK